MSLFFPSPMSPLPLLSLFLSLAFAFPLTSVAQAPPVPKRCGGLPIPFPFHLNASGGPPSPPSASPTPPGPTPPSASLSLLRPTSASSPSSPPAPSSSSSACDRWYAGVNRSLGLDGSPFFAVTADNLLRLYDCEDSSICRAGCDGIEAVAAGSAVGFEGGNRTDFGCCHPLSDGRLWKAGDGFSVFAEFGCRGFSSWAVRWGGHRRAGNRGRVGGERVRQRDRVRGGGGGGESDRGGRWSQVCLRSGLRWGWLCWRSRMLQM